MGSKLFVFPQMSFELSSLNINKENIEDLEVNDHLIGSKYIKNLAPTKEKVGIQLMLVVNNTVWGGCTDGSICVWDIKTGNLLGSRKGHRSGIISMIKVTNKYSPTNLESFSVWTGATYQDEAKNVSCMKQVGEYVWCGSLQGTICIYHCTTLKKLGEVVCTSTVRCMELVEDIMWVCTDQYITRFDTRNLNELENPIKVERVNSLVPVYKHNQIWGASSDQSIYIWNIDTGELCKEIKDFSSGKVLCLKNFHDLYIWSSGYDSVVRIWDAETHELIKSLDKVHSSAISTIALVPYTFESDLDDETQKTILTIWCADWEGEISVWV